VDEIILDVICAVSGTTVFAINQDGSDSTTAKTTIAHRSVQNPFLAVASKTTTTTTSAEGLIGSIQLLVAPELLGTTPDLVDRWMQKADQTVLAIVRQQSGALRVCACFGSI
jgi:hypothetical protein